MKNIPALNRLISAETVSSLARKAIRDTELSKSLAKLTSSENLKTGDNATWIFAKASEDSDHSLNHLSETLFHTLIYTSRSPRRRNLLKFFINGDVPEEIEGGLFSLSLNLAGNPSEAIAVRCLALSVAAKIALKYPDLSREVELIKNLMETETSPAIRARIRKLKSASLL